MSAPDPGVAGLHGAFVAGATGYVGQAVVRALGGAAARPVAHVRPDSPRRAEWQAAFTAMRAVVDATPWDEDALAATLTRLRPPAVFALLGTTRRRGRATGDTYASVDYGLSALLLRAVRRAAADTGVAPRFVYLSALGADATSRSAYLAVRGRFEAELTASGLPYVVVRPSVITGPDRAEARPAERVAAVVLDAAMAPLRLLGAGRLSDRYRSIGGGELARALVHAAAAPSAVGRILEGDALRG